MEQEQTKKPQEPEDVSESYVLSMRTPQATLNLSESDPSKHYITAKHPGVNEDDIWATAVPLSMQAPAGQNRAEMGNVTVTGNVSAAKGFIAKCVYQIVDYAIGVEELDGTVKVRRWDSANGGDNGVNREVYTQFLQAEHRDLVEGFLDMVAGRDTDAQRDFEELKKERPQLLNTS